MSQAERQYCKIFINSHMSFEKLVMAITAAAQGRADGCYVHGKFSELDVMSNSDHDPKKMERRDDPDYFLYFPVFVDAEPRNGNSKREYIGELREIISELRRNGCSVVPACSFEDELNVPGEW